MVCATLQVVDFMDTHPLAQATPAVSLRVDPLLPVPPEFGSPEPGEVDVAPDDRFAEGLTESAITDGNGRIRVRFEDEPVFGRLAGLERNTSA
jgi:hypothetical protein